MLKVRESGSNWRTKLVLLSIDPEHEWYPVSGVGGGGQWVGEKMGDTDVVNTLITAV